MYLKEASKKIWNYLCLKDRLEKADLVFVFGGHTVKLAFIQK